MNLMRLPIDIIDRIFLNLPWKKLEQTREIQSNYVKKATKYNNYIEAIHDNNIQCIEWLSYRKLVLDIGVIEEARSSKNEKILKWIKNKKHETDYRNKPSSCLYNFNCSSYGFNSKTLYIIQNVIE